MTEEERGEEGGNDQFFECEIWREGTQRHDKKGEMEKRWEVLTKRVGR